MTTQTTPPGTAGQAAPLDALLADAALGTFRRSTPDAPAAKLAIALAGIGAGTSALALARADRRFADPAWTGNAGGGLRPLAAAPGTYVFDT